MINWNDAKTLSYEEKRKIELMSYEEIIDIGQKLCMIPIKDNEYKIYIPKGSIKYEYNLEL